MPSNRIRCLIPLTMPVLIASAHGGELPNFERIELTNVPPLGYEIDGEPRGISQWRAADVNGDGLEDLILALTSGPFTEVTQPTEPLILVSDGLGSLVDKTHNLIDGPIPRLHITRGILVRDFNGDGRADIFFNNHGKEQVVNDDFPCEPNVLLISGSDGKLRDVSTSNLPQFSDFSHGSTAADIDSDGDIDIWVNNLGCQNGPPSYLLENDGTGLFSIVANTQNYSSHEGFVGANGRLPQTFIAENGAFWTLFVDADVDGDPDLFYQSNSEPFSLGLLLNDGNGAFSVRENAVVLESPVLDGIHDAEAVDIDHDGDEDLIVLDLDGPATSNFMIRILVSNGDGTFSEETSSRLLADQPFVENFGWPTLNVTDLNGDTNPEILYSTSAFEFSGEFRFDFSSDSSGTFGRIPLALMPKELDGSDRFYPVDTGGRGISDLVTLTDAPGGFPELALVMYKAVEQDDADADGLRDDDEASIGTDPENPDSDGDGTGDLTDNCPKSANPQQADADGDRVGDACDPDDDNDGALDAEDDFPLDPMEQSDFDGDGIGDNADNDDDNDGVRDTQDAFPLDGSETIDTDGDGIGNNADDDDDGDGLSDSEEVSLGTDHLSKDSDSDGLSDGDEIELGTDPLNEDTDGDSMSDGFEVEEGFDPNDGSDCPSYFCGGMSPGLKVFLIERARANSS